MIVTLNFSHHLSHVVQQLLSRVIKFHLYAVYQLRDPLMNIRNLLTIVFLDYDVQMINNENILTRIQLQHTSLV